jgi:hypothetical protein
VILALLAVIAGGPPGADGLPTVPGVSNPAVTQANIQQTICVPGWAAKQRPPSSYTEKIKFALMDKARIPRTDSSKYELDHDHSIEDGGSPTDPNNLWLEPYFGPLNAHQKDRVETLVKHLICTGKMPLSAAGPALQNWPATYRARIGPLP